MFHGRKLPAAGFKSEYLLERSATFPDEFFNGVANMAEEVVVLYHGRVDEAGTIAEIS